MCHLLSDEFELRLIEIGIKNPCYFTISTKNNKNVQIYYIRKTIFLCNNRIDVLKYSKNIHFKVLLK